MLPSCVQCPRTPPLSASAGIAVATNIAAIRATALTNIPMRLILSVISSSSFSCPGNPFDGLLSVFTRKTMTLPYRRHIVKTTYFSVSGYLIFPLFTGLPLRVVFLETGLPILGVLVNPHAASRILMR
jgi:hypothetical protein